MVTKNENSAAEKPGVLTMEAFEHIAQGWDGCAYEDAMIDDIGAALRRDFARLAAPAPVTAAQAEPADINAMVNRFLGWQLPASLSANLHPGIVRPIGTHLMNADEARAMFSHCLKGAARPTDDHLWDETLRDRDQYHEWADKLAGAIAVYFGVDIGEHSNMNCLWAEALDVIEGAAPAAAQAVRVPDLHNAIMNLTCTPVCNWPHSEQVAYRKGHRDARHAAAELVAEAAAPAATTAKAERVPEGWEPVASADALHVALAALESCKQSRYRDIDHDWITSRTFDDDKVEKALKLVRAAQAHMAPAGTGSQVHPDSALPSRTPDQHEDKS